MPALCQADVGIAVASVADVAKAAASPVLARPGLADIIHAIDGSQDFATPIVGRAHRCLTQIKRLLPQGCIL